MTKLPAALVLSASVTASSAARADFNDMARTMSNIFTYSNNITQANVLYSAERAQQRIAIEGTAAIEHAPLTTTDFRPARPGHPSIDRWLASPAAAGLGPNVRSIVAAFDRQLHRNNLAVSATLALETAIYVLDHRTFDAAQEAPLLAAVNDTIAAAPALHIMSAADKQQMSDAWLLASAVMVQYEQTGNHDASVALARQMLAAFGVQR